MMLLRVLVCAGLLIVTLNITSVEPLQPGEVHTEGAEFIPDALDYGDDRDNSENQRRLRLEWESGGTENDGIGDPSRKTTIVWVYVICAFILFLIMLLCFNIIRYGVLPI